VPHILNICQVTQVLWHPLQSNPNPFQVTLSVKTMMSRLNKRLQHRPPLFGSQEGFAPKQGAHIGRWTTNKGVFHSVRCRWQYVFPADVTNSRMKMQQHSDGVS